MKHNKQAVEKMARRLYDALITRDVPWDNLRPDDWDKLDCLQQAVAVLDAKQPMIDALLSAYHALSEVEMHWRPKVVTEAVGKVHDVLVSEGIIPEEVAPRTAGGEEG